MMKLLQYLWNHSVRLILNFKLQTILVFKQFSSVVVNEVKKEKEDIQVINYNR